MKSKLTTFSIITLSAFAYVPAFATTSYDVTITNGSNMPISPAIVYAAPAQSGVRKGETATPGFVAVCQSGDVATRATELRKQSKVAAIETTTGPILPSESRTVTIALKDPSTQAIHIETMYGKSKDICGVAYVGSHELIALKKHVSQVTINQDLAVTTGRFLSPSVDGDYLKTSDCEESMSAVECLRELSKPAMPIGRITAFSGYLPSVLKLIEEKFGASETQSLLIPSSGAITIETKLNH